ncbi:hypothetical protein V494_00918 [Pseudogymnoascus sp. VKM F-4513 (FW-928)]|nr:hypothetical protein V494_00918 [Pseudogymnoascus sp. VKM F-4513 (FW-928)]
MAGPNASIDPAYVKYNNMIVNRHKYFRWTKRTAFLSFACEFLPYDSARLRLCPFLPHVVVAMEADDGALACANIYGDGGADWFVGQAGIQGEEEGGYDC